METKHCGHREMCLHGKNKGLRSPIHGFCRFVLYLCLFAAVPHLLRPRQKAQHQKHRADCLFTHLYAWGEPLWILLLLFSSFFNWFIGILIGKFRDTPRAKLAVGGGIFVDILLLLIFKYSAFIVENLNAVSARPFPCRRSRCPSVSASTRSRLSPTFWTATGKRWTCSRSTTNSFCTCPSSRSSSPAQSCGTALWSRRSTTVPSTRPTYAKVRCA